MRPAFDVLIVGSGPSGVAAAFPLVEAGLRVAMVDGGEVSGTPSPDGEMLALRRHDAGQSRWMIGDDGHALREQGATSPKFRAAPLAYVFRGFAAANGIVAEGFGLVGSLAVGGLSNAWGCGIARFGGDGWYPGNVAGAEFDAAYAAVAARIGLCGGCDDDLSSFFGVDALADPPLPLDPLHAYVATRYEFEREALTRTGFRLGRARLAVLVRDRDAERRGCDARGTCLWGCARGAMYSSRQDLPALSRHARFTHLPGRVVRRLVREREAVVAEIDPRGGTPERLGATRVLLAAGTLASTAIAMRSLDGFRAAALLHLPMAAFAVAVPRFLAHDRQPGVGTAQLAFTLDGERPQEVCGFTFATHGLPVAEFLRHAPLSRAAGATVFRALLPATLVANCFLPSRFARSRVVLDADVLHVRGELAPELAGYAGNVRHRLARAFRRCGAFLLPGSFTLGAVGADAHYAGTMPMRARPARGETDADGALEGLPGVHVVDGAALPVLPSKSHTLALMANAHRIGVRVARALAAAR